MPKTKWSKELILSELRRVYEEDGDVTRDTFRVKGKIPTSQIDKYFDDFSSAKKEMMTKGFTDKLLGLIKSNKNKLDLEELCNQLDASPKVVKDTVDSLIKQGYAIKFRDKKFTLDKLPDYSTNTVHKFELKAASKYIEFAVVADTHLASKHECLEELKFFYNVAHNEYGIKTFLHAGDLVAGINMYFGQENELKYWGSDAQVNYFVDNYPCIPGVTTHFITGNHDLCYLKNAGKDIGIDISNQRKDMHYLGQYLSTIELGPVRVEVHHIDKGTAYACSYPLQKTIEATPDKNKPHLLFCGHLHQKLWLEQRGINAFLAGCFEQQSLWLKRKKLMPSIGGYIIKVGLDGDKIRSVSPTFIECV